MGIGKLIEALARDDGSFEEVGVSIGHLYTDFGLPIDMALERLGLEKWQKLVVLHGALEWMIEHRSRSNATEKAIERLRVSNRRAIELFIRTGESGVY